MLLFNVGSLFSVDPVSCRKPARIAIIWVVLFLAMLPRQSHAGASDDGRRIDLSGQWLVRLDDKGEGIQNGWFNEFKGEPVHLPGSLGDSGLGLKDATSGDARNTRDWTHLYTFRGLAWYQKEVTIPAGWAGKRVVLFFERAHWFTQVWVDGTAAGPRQTSLSAPQTHVLTGRLTPGKHRLTVAVDSRKTQWKVENSHHFWQQGYWNGIIGRIELQATDAVWIKSLQAYPDLAKKSVRVLARVENESGQSQAGSLQLRICSRLEGRGFGRITVPFTAGTGGCVAEARIPIEGEVRLWDEFTPNLYDLHASLSAGAFRDSSETSFGMREFKAKGRQLTMNGRVTFMRGRVDDGIYPKTAYPPMDVGEWKKLFLITKQWGFNHWRFHSWCPPEAAFQAADETGFYLLPEVVTVGNLDNKDREEEERWLVEEPLRMLEAYGNHPSFVMMDGGNEIVGNEAFVRNWKAQDSRRLYSHAANGGGLKLASDFWVTMTLSRVNWGRSGDHPCSLRGGFHDPLVGYINNTPPSTMVDFTPTLAGVGAPEGVPPIDRPVIAHELGMWNAYPDFRLIDKCTGAVRQRNFEVFRETLAARHMLDQADAFVKASGSLQVLLYKEEIEAQLRTPNYGGFEMLDIQDYPGQGTAVCGILDSFMESKGYGDPAEFRHWCSPTVPLLRMKQFTWTTAETFDAGVQVAHYGAGDLNAPLIWKIENSAGATVASGTFAALRITPGNLVDFGRIQQSLAQFPTPASYRVTLSIPNSSVINDWDIWVYPNLPPAKVSERVVTGEKWDAALEQALAAGKSVLYLPKATALPHSIPGCFTTDLWCYNMYKGFNPPGTMGMLCNPDHPALAAFPTQSHSNWQWWDLLKNSRSLILDELPPELHPIVQIIDNPVRNQKLGALFECRVGSGKLMVCSMDLASNLEARPAARQLRCSLLNYMGSDRFQPVIALSANQVASLGRSKSEVSGIAIEEPVGLHRAVIEVRAGANLGNLATAAWTQAFDGVKTKQPGFDYTLNADCQVVANFGTTFWQARVLEFKVSCPKGWTGIAHLHLKDINHWKRSGSVSLNGRKLGEIKNHEDGVWIAVPLKKTETAGGKINIEVVASPKTKDLIVTDLVLMPTGESDPG